MGDVDVNCYDNNSNISYDNLSRIGAVRLLDAIASSCQGSFVVDNWKEMKQNLHKSINALRKSVTVNEEENGNHFVNHNVRYRGNSKHQDGHYSSVSYNVKSARNDLANSRNNLNRQRFDGFNYCPGRNGIINNRLMRKRGCYNCGEYNHRQSNCRYDHQLKCNYCYEYGHMSRLCNIANTN